VRAAALLAALLCAAAARAEEADDLEAAAKALASDSVAERVRATRILQQAGEKARPILKTLAEAADPEVRARARRILEKLDVPPLLRALRSRDLLVRTRALQRLLKQGPEKTTAFLQEHADHRLAPALTDIMRFHFEHALRSQTRDLLVSLGPPENLPGLAWALRSTLGHNDTLVKTLGKQGDLSIIPDLLARAERIPGEKPAIDAAIAAIRRRHPRGDPPKKPLADPARFLTWLKGDSIPHRVLAIRATVTGMTWMEEPRAAVLAALKAGEPVEVRRAAAEALSYLGPGDARQPLVLAAGNDPDVRVRVLATIALGKIDQDLVRAFLVLRASQGQTGQDRRAALSALSENGDAATLRALEKLAPEDLATRKQLERTVERIRQRLRKKKS
jgi:HEAT repeat protein